MQIQPETIIWDQPSATSKAVAKSALVKPDVFRLEKMTDDRINGSVPVWGQPKTPEENITSSLTAAEKPKTGPELSLAETDTPAEFGFLDLVDMINPLQHIPVVSTIYRNMTGDTIKPMSRVVGGAAFGGPLGAASGVVNALFQIETGKDVADNMVASAEGKNENDTTIALANLRHHQPHYNS